jgi:glycosyltransferase involved in cell wall biosynthesis
MSGLISFSIVIPTYNRAAVIGKTISTALNQSYTNYEIIIVDDGGTDNTEEVIRAFGNEKISYYRKENGERAAARNYGAAKAKGDYVTFLDSDDLLHPSYLQNAKECIEKNNYPPFIHVAYEIRDGEGKLLSTRDFMKSDTIEFLVDGNPLSCLGVLVKREIFLRHKFNEDRRLTASEDWELWLRLIANYGIKTDRRIAATMVYHQNRSVLETDEQSMLQRKELAMEYAFRDDKVKAVYGRYKTRMRAFSDSYIALHLALAGKKSTAVAYLSKAIRLYPLIIFSRRCMAIIKHIF